MIKSKYLRGESIILHKYKNQTKSKYRYDVSYISTLLYHAKYSNIIYYVPT